MDGTGREDHRNNSAAGGDAAATLVESALQLRWSAPELALLLADRAAAIGLGGTAGGRAALIAATSLNRLGREVEAGTRALAGLQHVGHVDPGGAEGDLDRQLQIELATAAVAVGAANAALSVLQPVLAADTGGTVVRASALVALAAALAGLDRADEAARALREADDLYQRYVEVGAEIGAEVGPDTAVLLRGMARAARSAQHRRQGDPAAAEAVARDGLALLSELSDPAQDGGAVSGRLVLELVLSLLDRGEHEAAVRAAAFVFDGSLRAAAAPSRSWLQLALAIRVHLPEGSHREALDLLGDAADCAERHSLEPVLAECLDGLCRIHEQRGEYAEALHCLRSAHAAGYRHRQAADALRLELIEEYGSGRRDVADLAEQVVGLVAIARARGDGTEPARQALESTAGGRRARHRQDDGQQRPVAELLSAAGRATVDSPGRRRVEDRPDTLEDDADTPGPAAPATLVSEPSLGSREVADDLAPPPAVTRSLDSPILTDLIGEEDREVGLGDLLAGALAAFEEGRRSSGNGAGRSYDQPADPATPAADIGRDSEPPVLPTLGNEQVWRLPDMGRRSAAGD
ncbi:MAG: hypothetical protein GEU83_08465 [Pseudonocardiaceae bacterium]|nr:hypothetical protein [Pseudonocardiaceae bacterium]